MFEELMYLWKSKGYNPNRVPSGPGGGRFASGSGGGAPAASSKNTKKKKRDDDDREHAADMASTDFKIHLERGGKVSKLPGELTTQVKSNKLRDVGDDLMDSDDLIPEGHDVVATVNGRQYNLTDGWEYMGPSARRKR